MPSFSSPIPVSTSGEDSSICSFDTGSGSSSGAVNSVREDDNDVPLGARTRARTTSTSQHRRYQRQQRHRQSVDRGVAVTVTSNVSGAGSRDNSTQAARSAASVSQSSTLSWSTAAPSISSAASQAVSHDAEDADANAYTHVEDERDGSGISHSHSRPRHMQADDAESSSSSRIYTCLFHMLDCHESFDDETHWTTHVLSHFRTHPPPPTARCPLCPNTKFVDGDPNPLSSPVSSPGPKKDEQRQQRDTKQDQDQYSETDPDNSQPSIRRIDSGTDVREDGPYTGIEIKLDHDHESDLNLNLNMNLENLHLDTDNHTGSAWSRLLTHVGAHYRAGQTLAGSRADFDLMRYLYGRRIISDAQFKATQLAPAPSSPAYHASQDGVRASIGSSDEPYCAPYSRRREERMRGQQKGVSVGFV